MVHALQILESANSSGLPFVARVSDEIYLTISDELFSCGNFHRILSGLFSFFRQFVILPIIVGFNERLITIDSASVCPISSFVAVHQDLYAFEYDLYQKSLLSKVFL